MELLKDGMDVMFCAAGRTPAQKDIKKAPVPFLDTSPPYPRKQTWEPDQLRWPRLERCIIVRPDHAPGALDSIVCERNCWHERLTPALQRLAHATTNKGRSPASPLQALVRLRRVNLRRELIDLLFTRFSSKILQCNLIVLPQDRGMLFCILDSQHTLVEGISREDRGFPECKRKNRVLEVLLNSLNPHFHFSQSFRFFDEGYSISSVSKVEKAPATCLVIIEGKMSHTPLSNHFVKGFLEPFRKTC
ncbi:MAG: hypothetical protein ABIU05_13435, partial [Nitrospirales bacterium]